MKNTAKKPPSKYRAGRYRLDFVEAIHFNNNGKKACTIIVVDPKHTRVRSEVTCTVCKKKMENL